MLLIVPFCLCLMLIVLVLISHKQVMDSVLKFEIYYER